MAKWKRNGVQVTVSASRRCRAASPIITSPVSKIPLIARKLGSGSRHVAEKGGVGWRRGESPQLRSSDLGENIVSDRELARACYSIDCATPSRPFNPLGQVFPPTPLPCSLHLSSHWWNDEIVLSAATNHQPCLQTHPLSLSLFFSLCFILSYLSFLSSSDFHPFASLLGFSLSLSELALIFCLDLPRHSASGSESKLQRERERERERERKREKERKRNSSRNCKLNFLMEEGGCFPIPTGKFCQSRSLTRMPNNRIFILEQRNWDGWV